MAMHTLYDHDATFVKPYIDAKIAEVAQVSTFNVDFTTGELMYSTGPYSFNINTTTGNLEWEVSA